MLISEEKFLASIKIITILIIFIDFSSFLVIQLLLHQFFLLLFIFLFDYSSSYKILFNHIIEN